MTEVPIARSISLTEQDKENRALALDLIKKSNEVVTSFAKQMTTTSLSVIGVILGLAKLRGFQEHAGEVLRIALAASCALCLIAALVFSLALRARQVRVSPDDYADAPAQLVEIAHRRELLTIWGLTLLAVAIAGAILLLILVDRI
jgi:hypothetical protein